MEQKNRYRLAKAGIAAAAMGGALIAYGPILRHTETNEERLRPITAAEVGKAMSDYSIMMRGFKPGFYYSPGCGQKPIQAVWCDTQIQLNSMERKAELASGLTRANDANMVAIGWGAFVMAMVGGTIWFANSVGSWVRDEFGEKE